MRNLKKILALALALVMTLSVMTVANAAFTDSSSIDGKYNEAVEVLSALKVFKGTGTGSTFSPKQSITRAEVAAIIYRIVTSDVDDTQAKIYADYNKFSDVKSSAWYAGYVNYCANAQLIKGDGAGKFNPGATVTGYQALAMILRAVGYDQNGEFTGSGWEVKTASTAQGLGILKNINQGTLGVAATREVVAEILFQAILVPTVTYTPALGYNQYTTITGATKNDTLGYKAFALLSTPTTADDIWGRPSKVWKLDTAANFGCWTAPTATDKTLVSFADTPVKTYTTTTKVCQLVADLGLTRDDTTQIYKNSNQAMYTQYALRYLDTTTVLYGTGTGVLTEVYALPNGDYRVVEIDTYLAKVTGVTPAKADALGHVTPASTALTVYATDATGVAKTFKSEAFTVGQYVLVNMTSDGVVRVVNPANFVTGALTGYNIVTETSVLGGATYNWAAKYFLGKTGTLFTTYNVYTDAYGNVIGLVQPTTAYSYGIITDIAWANSYQPLDDAKVYANLKSFANTDTNGTVVAGKWNQTVVTPFTSAGNGQGSYANGTVSTIKAENQNYYNAAYQFTTLANGAQVIVAQGTAETGKTIKTGVPTVMTSYAVTNDNTVYLVKTGNAATGYTYTVYTGYKTVPSMSNVNVSYFAEKGYVTYCFVDASNATFTGTSEVAYITSGANVGVDNGLYAYYIYVNGVPTLKTSAASTLPGFNNADLYTVTYDANGNIVSVANYVPTAVHNVKFYNGTVITDENGVGVNCTDAGLYCVVVSATNGVSVVAGSAAELTAGNVTAYLVMNATNTQATAIYYVVNVA